MIRAVVNKIAVSPADIPINFPMEIMRPAAGMTAMTTISAFPSFCQKSNEMSCFMLSFPSLKRYVSLSIL